MMETMDHKQLMRIYFQRAEEEALIVSSINVEVKRPWKYWGCRCGGILKLQKSLVRTNLVGIIDIQKNGSHL